MRTSLLTLLILAGLTASLAAQIPNTWTPESLKKIYGSGTSIGYQDMIAVMHGPGFLATSP
jgi:hypothetical protein